jgi:beta-phosphoglucomutase
VVARRFCLLTMPACQAILFDFDGVLVDSEPVHFRCWRDLGAPLGITIDWQTYSENFIGVSTRQMLQSFCDRPACGTTIESLLELLPDKRRMFVDILCRERPFAADCHAMLQSLSDYRLAVVTSSNRAEVEPVLEAVGIRQYFGALICGGDVQRHKPFPDPYLKAAELLGVSTALVVEDSEVGVQSAQAAGFEVLRVGNPAEVWPALRRRLRQMSGFR